jgi:transposase-like protein
MRQLRSYELDELEVAYQAGATVYQLAERFGINRVTVGKHLRRRGVDTTPPGLHPDSVPRAAELYRQGWSLARIGQEFGTTASTVRSRLIETGVRMRAPWEQTSRPASQLDFQIDRIGDSESGGMASTQAGIASPPRKLALKPQNHRRDQIE